MLIRRMIPHSLTLAACLALAGPSAHAQTAAPAQSPAQAAAIKPDSSATASAPSLTLEQIVAKNVAARGGLTAWHAVQTMTESGVMDAGSTAKVQLPFKLEMKRPRKTRLEIVFNGQTAVQAYDGTNGWTLRPYLGRANPEPFNSDELSRAAEQQDLDGPLFDYASKGIKAELAGVEKVEGHDAYKIKLTLPNKAVRHIWIDAQSFLELKIEDTPRILNGRPHPVATYFRDYRTVDGLTIPFVLETAVKDVVGTKKLIIDKVAVNPPVEDAAFGKPQGLPPTAFMRRPASPVIRKVPPIKR
jgi:hypothetical protein